MHVPEAHALELGLDAVGSLVSGLRICLKVGMTMPRSLQRLAVRLTTDSLMDLTMRDMDHSFWRETRRHGMHADWNGWETEVDWE